MSDENNWNGEERRTNGNGRSTFERHAQTVLAIAVAAGIAWLGSTNIELGKEQSKTATQIGQMREDVRELRSELARVSAERYTAAEARREMQRFEDRIDRLEQRDRARR